MRDQFAAVGAHLCAINSRLKAAPTIIITGRGEYNEISRIFINPAFDLFIWNC